MSVTSVGKVSALRPLSRKGQDVPRQMQARIVADTKGPGPCRALMYKKNAEPKKRKTAFTIEGYNTIFKKYRKESYNTHRCFDVFPR